MAIEAVTAALKEEGFGVLMTLDLQGKLRQKLGVERPPYTLAERGFDVPDAEEGSGQRHLGSPP